MYRCLCIVFAAGRPADVSLRNSQTLAGWNPYFNAYAGDGISGDTILNSWIALGYSLAVGEKAP